jgi:plastocyanin
MENHAGGIAMVAFIVALAVSMTYYQFIYIPQANAKPILPEEVLNPESSFRVTISPGSSLEANPEFFVPADVRTTIGIDSRVIWENEDTVPHTVTSDDGYVDQINGPFNSLEQQESVPGGFVREGMTFEFVFTKVGNYAYHCEPHPWMQGSIEVVENFA